MPYSAKYVQIKQDIFARNNAEALFQKFIHPKAQMRADVDYGYNDFERSRYALLTHELPDLHHKVQVFLDGGFLEVDKSFSQERLRRTRKTALDVIFTFIVTGSSMTGYADLKTHIFTQLDACLTLERDSQTDTDYGSFHHVLFGMCSGNDDVILRLW